MRRARNVFAALALIAASVALGLGALELFTRLVVGTPWPERMPLARVVADPVLGFRMLPHDRHYTYDIPVRLNALGFRGPEVPAKEAQEYRIAVFGDSHVYGQGIADDDLVTAVMEGTLNADPSARCRYRVVNLGVRAYSTNQELALLGEIGPRLAPDHVVVFFYVNDFDPVNVARRYAEYRRLDWYMFDISGKPEGWRLDQWNRIQMLRRSAFVMWAHDLYRAATAETTLEERVLRGNRDAAVDAAIDRAAALIADFAKLAGGMGASFTLVAVPHAGQIRGGSPESRYPKDLRDFAERNGMAFHDLRPALAAAFPDGPLPLIPFDGHYDARGQRAMGEAVAARLRLPPGAGARCGS